MTRQAAILATALRQIGMHARRMWSCDGAPVAARRQRREGRGGHADDSRSFTFTHQPADTNPQPDYSLTTCRAPRVARSPRWVGGSPVGVLSPVYSTRLTPPKSLPALRGYHPRIRVRAQPGGPGTSRLSDTRVDARPEVEVYVRCGAKDTYRVFGDLEPRAPRLVKRPRTHSRKQRGVSHEGSFTYCFREPTVSRTVSLSEDPEPTLQSPSPTRPHSHVPNTALYVEQVATQPTFTFSLTRCHRL